MDDATAPEPAAQPTASDPTAPQAAASEKAASEEAASEEAAQEEAAAFEPAAAQEAVAPATVAAPRRPLVVALAVVAVLLLASTATLGVLYGRARSDLAARDKSLAAQAAERERLQTELTALTARRTELEAKLASAEARLLDPKGYELIKKCVSDHAAAERAIRDAIASGKTVISRPGRAVFVNPGTGFVSMDCADAEPYLR